jgi:opacity protein-like surface antigen
MKKICLVALLLTSFITRSSAQDFYLKAGAGYAFAMPGQKLDEYGNVLNGTLSYSGNSSTSSIRSASFSSGVQGTIGCGLMLSKNIGIELNSNINLAPRNYTAKKTGQTNNNGDYTYIAERKANNLVVFLPSLLLQTANNTWNLYTRMGLALPVNTGIKLHESYLYRSGTANQYYWNITNYFSLGFSAAAGVTMKINETISLYGEAGMLSLSILRKERDLESADLDGKIYSSSQLKGGITKYHYNKNGISDGGQNQPALAQPYGNLSITAGLSYHFNNHPAKKSH